MNGDPHVIETNMYHCLEEAPLIPASTDGLTGCPED